MTDKPANYLLFLTADQRAFIARAHLDSDAPSMAALIKRALKDVYPAFPYHEDPDSHYHKIWAARSAGVRRARKNNKTLVKA